MKCEYRDLTFSQVKCEYRDLTVFGLTAVDCVVPRTVIRVLNCCNKIVMFDSY